MKFDFNKIFLEKWKPYLWIILIILCLYAQTIFFDYVYLDDNNLIMERDQFLSDWSSVGQSFKEDAFNSHQETAFYYRPLLTTSFIIDAHLGGTSSLTTFHITDIILHIITTILLLILLKQLKITGKKSFLLTILFSLHPIHLQAVAFIPGRNDPLLTIFILAAFIFFIKFIGSEKYRFLILSLLAYTASLFTKETAIMFPLIAIIYLITNNYKIFKIKNLIYIVSTIPITLIWLDIRSKILNSSIIEDWEKIISSVLKSSSSIISYLGKITFPINLSPLPIKDDLPLIYGIIALFVFGFICYFSLKNNFSKTILGISWFLLFLFPALIQYSTPFPSFSEHRVYLPLIGLIIILGSFKWSTQNHKLKKIMPTVLSVGTIIVLGLFLTKTITHARVYEDKISFWTSAVKYSPNSAFNHNNLGAMYYIDGNYAQAKEQWLIAKKLNPNEPLVSNNLGLIYDLEGEYNKAYNEYLKELQINPNYANAHYNLSLLLLKTGYPDKAAEGWQKTIELNPDYFSAYNNLSAYYLEQGDLNQAKYYINTLIERGGVPITGLLEKINEKN